MRNSLSESRAAEGRLLLTGAIWEHFKRTAEWPTRKAMLLLLDEHGYGLDAVLSTAPNIGCSYGERVEVYASLRELAEAVPEVRELLAPIPKLLSIAAARYIEWHPFVDEGEGPRITYDDICTVSGRLVDVGLMIRLLMASGWGPLSFGNATGPEIKDRYARASIDHLRFQQIESLEDVFEVEERCVPIEVGKFPSGRPREVLVAIYRSAEKEGRWPEALPFAVEHRNLGDIRSVLSALGRFIRGDYGEHRHNVLALNPLAVLSVDPSGELRQRLLDIAQGIARLWKKKDEPIALRELSEHLGVEPYALRVPVLFFEWTEWGHATLSGRADPDRWHFRATERVLENLNISSWDEYLEMWHSDFYSSPIAGAAFGVGDDDALVRKIEIEAIPLVFVRDEKLRDVLERDVAELHACLKSSAWKAALVLAGGIVEAMLIDVLRRQPSVAESHLSPKARKKGLERSGLNELLSAAFKSGLVQPSTLPLAGVVKDYRNLIHPMNAVGSSLRTTSNAANAVVHCLRIVADDLCAAMANGALSRYEMQ